MVEAVANGVEDKLVDGLSFKLSPGASYVTNRRSVTFHPQGSNVYEPGSGTRLIRIQLTGDEWLDPSTFRIAFDLVNKNSGSVLRVRPLSGPYSFFRRCRLIAGGQVIEDIDNFNRVSHMLQLLKSKHSRMNDISEGFGAEWSEHQFHNLLVRPKTPFVDGDLSDDKAKTSLQVSREIRSTTFEGILAGESQRVLFKPALGLFNQTKYLPIRYMPLTLELELVTSADDPVLSTCYDNAAADASVTNAKTTFYKDNTNSNWRIENVEVKCDLITLDNALDNSYAEHLLSGKSLPINYNTFVSQMQTIKDLKPNVSVSRALTRLKAVFVTLDKDGEETLYTPGNKSWRLFYSPMSPENRFLSSPDHGAGSFKHTPLGEFSFQLQIGSKLYPEYPIRSHSEAFYQLKKTLGVQSSDVHSFDINARQYRDARFILGIDTEKVLDAGWTGLNTRSGDLMSVKFEFLEATRIADRMHIVLHSDQIVEIRDGGVQVFD